ncbi:PoNe immunity protein domain-containing protein [Candidatus Merdisoma sp. JLR.KK011]|uniref:PoNe immunity protein domain-containing protein n=1 Tax=Candidatus Merdisoma sp. JLR.KK011 TaxID=3114299 RepID=UPI002FF2732B
MRDYLCNEEELKDTIEFDEKQIINKWEQIDGLLKDIQEGIQRKPKKNEDILFSVKKTLFRLANKLIRAKYSLGLSCKELEDLYLQALSIVSELGFTTIGYVNFLQYFALGILLEVDEDKIKDLVKKADEDNLDDFVFDFLVSSYGLKRDMISSNYQKENPYKLLAEIVEISFHDKNAAAQKLNEYIKKKWLRGHADYGWMNAHKEAGYVGLWSFEAAAVAKILRLDDSKLEDDNHYPYDLTHFKDNKEFVLTQIKELNKLSEPELYEIGITKNKELEQIIPAQFHKLINQLLLDYVELEDQMFWRKYNLDELWFTVDAYIQEKRSKEILGEIIVNVLVNCGYILQLDYKESLEDYMEDLADFWKTGSVKIIRFEIGNDQYYYAKVPQDSSLKGIYEIELIDTNFEDE